MRFRELLWVCLGLCLAGCAGDTAATPASGDTIEPTVATAGPAFPADGPARSVRAVETLVLEGLDFHAQSGTYTPGLSSITLDPGFEEISFAIYRFQLGTLVTDRLDFVITPNNPARSWIALADYDSLAWDYTPFETGLASLPVTAANISENGYLFVAVVSWNNSETVVDQLSVEIDLPVWTAHVVDDQGNPGVVLSGTGHNGLPTVAYTAPGATELRFARALDLAPSESAHWDVSVIATTTDATALDYRPVVLYPMVAYADTTTGDSAFARATTYYPTGPADWITAFPGADTTGASIALAEVNGTPAVAYVDPGMSLHSIDYTYTTLAAPTNPGDWLVTEAISNPLMPPFSDFGNVVLLTYHQLPHLLYFNETLDMLFFAYGNSAEPTGNSNWNAYPVDEAGTGSWCRSMNSNVLPTVAYINHTTGSLVYARANNWTPSAGDWGTRHLIDDSGHVNGPVDAGPAGSHQGVAYYDSDAQAILYAWSENAGPVSSAEWTIMTAVKDVGADPAFSYAWLQDGTPCLFYHDAVDEALKFAVMSELPAG